jgi:hypothetical protein
MAADGLDYPEMTRCTPSTLAALTLAEVKSAVKLVPEPGVVPVISPSEALAVPDRVNRYGFE